MSACTIPARKVSLDIGEIRMEGEASNFVDILAGAIKGWPKRVEDILIEVPTDDFIRESKNANKFKGKVTKLGKVTLAGGWIPKEKELIALINTIKKDRPALRRFRLVVSVRSASFTSVVCKPILELEYIKPETSNPKATKAPNTSGTKDKPIDVEDFDASKPKQSSKRSDEPETNVILHQSVIQELDDAVKNHEEESEMGGDDFDSYDEFEEEMAMMQENADEYAGVTGFDDDDEDDVLFGMGGRPRWSAF